GEITWTVYEVGYGVAVPYPGLPDVGFLLAVPLTIAGILTFGDTARGTSLGLDTVVQSQDANLLEKVFNVAYPVGDIAIATVLVLAIRRATHETQGRL